MITSVLEGQTTAGLHDPIWAEPTASHTGPTRRTFTELKKPTLAPPLQIINWILDQLDQEPDTASIFAFRTLLLLPRPTKRGVPRLQQMILELRRLTGWSDRMLATRVGTTHPTIANAAEGSVQAFARSPEIYAHLEALHRIVVRIAPLVDRDPLAVDRVLTSKPRGSDTTALEKLAADDLPGAYLAALDTLHATDPDVMMRFPRKRGGDATSDLAE
jgi:hypothetical protein